MDLVLRHATLKSMEHKFKDREVPEKIIPAVVKFYDIAGLVKGASQGEGLGNQFLSHIREVDAVMHLVRDFTDENILRSGSTNPRDDISVINTELILADIQTITKRFEKAEFDIRKSRSKENLERYGTLNKVKGCLDRGELANAIDLSKEEKEYIKDLNLLTLKPMIYVYNISEDSMNNISTHDIQEHFSDALFLCAKVEADLGSFDEKERLEYMRELGLAESGLDRVIKKCYETLGLETYFTAGPKEVHAWTFEKGLKAPQAAGIIHTDFERGFISAEILPFSKLTEAGSWRNAKDKGLVRVEGKEYTVEDGDVVEFRFSV